MDDTFQAILSVNRPVPIAIKYLFDFLDELAEKHGIEDPETLHIWKTNRYLACWPPPHADEMRSPSGIGAWPGAGTQAPCGTRACAPSLLLRFWVNALKNPQLIFDVRVSDNVDAVLAVIAQTFIDSCTVSEHKVGRVRAELASAAARGMRRKGFWGKPQRLRAEPRVELRGVAHNEGRDAGGRGHWWCIRGDRAGAPPASLLRPTPTRSRIPQ